MSEQQQKKEVAFGQEFRLGLVVYGGVSLAIYMNGVCREFYEAVRGRGIYKLIKALTDSDIVVDIISGTSAGGVNGVLLSYALTNSTREKAVEFSSFANVWRESGDIDKLLREVDPFKVPANINSVLNGEGYYQNQLFEALKKAEVKEVETADEWFSDFSELDLFVTGTDVLGKVYNTFDNTGRVIEIKDHRCVFHLKYRQDRKHPFAPITSTQEALAKLCRITSCFPVAFPVVCVKLDDEKHADAQLVEWGVLKNRNLPAPKLVPPANLDQGSRQLYFVDGGVLDNRPFGYTIQEIYYRTAYRPVSRKLFYIDPSPDRFFDSKTYREMPKPNVIQVASDSLVGMPRYESIANDLKSIEEHNRKVSRYRRLMEAVEEFDFSSDRMSGVSTNQLTNEEYIYLRCRFIELRDRILPLILQVGKFSDDDATENTNQTLEKRKLLEKSASLLAQTSTTAEEQKSRENILRDLTKKIRNLDVEYALRKHFFLLEKVWQMMSNLLKSNTLESRERQYKELKFLAGDISKQLELLEVVRAALEYMLQFDAVNQSFKKRLEQVGQQLKHPESQQIQQLEEQPIYQIYDYFLRLHRFLLDSNQLSDFNPSERERKRPINPLTSIPKDFFTAWLGRIPAADCPDEPQPYGVSTQEISSIFAQLKERAEALTGDVDTILTSYSFKGDENDNDEYRSILRQIEKRSEALIQFHCKIGPSEQTRDHLLEEFRNFRNLDQVIYSYEYLAGFRSKETIELLRISPDDAKRGFSKGKSSDAKLAGDQLRAFGGFFKRSWRSNDILWGRLDGLNRLVDALLTPESLKNFRNFVQRQTTNTNLTDYLQQFISEIIPASASDKEKADLLKFLEKLANGETLAEGENDEFEKFLDLVVTIGHREIVNTDLDKIIQDEIEEQMGWDVQRVQSKPSQAAYAATSPLTPPIKYVPAEWAFSQTVNPLVAQSIALDTMKQLDKERFFRENYRVGSETLADGIPAIVLKNFLARTGLVLRNVIANLPSDPVRSRRLRQNGIYQVVNRVLQLFYIVVQRRSPRSLQPSRTASLLNLGFILLFAVLTGLIVIVASLVAIFFQLPLWSLTALGAIILLVSLLLLKWAWR